MHKQLIILASLFHLSVFIMYGLPQLSDPGLVSSYLARAETLYERSDYDSLPWYYSEALKISSGINDTTDIIRCYLGLAEYYRLISDYQNASAYLTNAREMMNGMKQQHFELQADMNYINGKILAGIGKYQEAIMDIWKASALDGTKDHKKNARYLNYIGNIYNMNGDYDSAEYCFRESFREINSIIGGPAVEKSWYYINISKIYNGRGELDSGLSYLEKSINNYTALFGEGYPDLMNSYLNLAYYYVMVGSPDTARFYLDKAEKFIYKDSITSSEFFPGIYECYGILSYSDGDYLQTLKAFN